MVNSAPSISSSVEFDCDCYDCTLEGTSYTSFLLPTQYHVSAVGPCPPVIGDLASMPQTKDVLQQSSSRTTSPSPTAQASAVAPSNNCFISSSTHSSLTRDTARSATPECESSAPSTHGENGKQSSLLCLPHRPFRTESSTRITLLPRYQQQLSSEKNIIQSEPRSKNSPRILALPNQETDSKIDEEEEERKKPVVEEIPCGRWPSCTAGNQSSQEKGKNAIHTHFSIRKCTRISTHERCDRNHICSQEDAQDPVIRPSSIEEIRDEKEFNSNVGNLRTVKPNKAPSARRLSRKHICKATVNNRRRLHGARRLERGELIPC